MSPADLAAYESGLMHGIDLGRRQVEDEITAEWAAVRAVVAATLARDAFADVCDQRADRAEAAGHHGSAAVNRARANLQRAILRANGVWPLPATTRTAA